MTNPGTNPAYDGNRYVMVDMEDCYLVLFFTKHKEKSVQKVDKLSKHIVVKHMDDTHSVRTAIPTIGKTEVKESRPVVKPYERLI